MRRHLPTRLVICAVMAGSASLAAVVVPGGVASASPLTVTCTSVSGSSTSQTVSGCTGTAAIAADAGTPPAHGTSVVSTHKITWSNGKTVKTSETTTSGAATSCPTVAGKTKVALEKATGHIVAGGTALGMTGGTIKASICLYKLTAAPHTLSVKNLGKVTF
jgi:hypothetical protein